MTTLNSKQRKTLRGLAHHLEPSVQIGKDGITDGVLGAAERALLDHELIKVKVLEAAPLSRSEAGEALSTKLKAQLVGEIGRIAILYKRHPKKPKLEF